LQAIGKHLPAFAQARLLDHHRGRLDRVAVLVELLVPGRRFDVGRQIGLGLLALSLTLLGSTTLASHELIRHHLDQQQLARQGAVPERILLVATDTHALAQVRSTGKYRRLPVQTGLTQAFAEVLVEVEQARLITQTLAVGRVTDHQAFLVLVRARLEGRDFALVNLDPVAQARTLDIVARWLDQARIGFITTNPQRWLGHADLGALGGFVVEFFPDGRNVTEPGIETPMDTIEVRCHIGGNHCTFDKERTHATHRVSQGSAFGGHTWPARTNQDGCREVFLQRGCTLLQTVATLVQAAARQVQRQNGFATVQAQVDAHVRADLVDRRTLAAWRAQFVDDGVLYLQRTEVGVVDTRTVTTELNGQGAIRDHMVLPVNVQHTVVQVFSVLHRETLEHQQHTVGKTRPQTQAVGSFHICHASNGRGMLAGFLQA